MAPDQRPDEMANPYASPVELDVAEETDSPEDFELRELRAFVRSNSRYYLAKWESALRGANAKTGFNWAAFLLSGVWLPYRKMYKVSLIFYAIIVLESLIEDWLFIGMLGNAETPPEVDMITGLLPAIVCGAYGNRWYLSHAQRKVAEARSSGLEGEALLQRLSIVGGTSIVGALGVLIMFIVSLSAFYAALFMVLSF